MISPQTGMKASGARWSDYHPTLQRESIIQQRRGAAAGGDRVHNPRPRTAIADVNSTIPIEKASRRIEDVNVCEYIIASQLIYK
jgi:hypothetical protein